MSVPKASHKCPFTIEEDRKLVQFVVANGPRNWGQIARELGNRTPKQCRERWNNQLDPMINKGPWTRQEDIIIAEQQRILGNKWAEISRLLPGRTDTLVKNRWNTSVKARVNELLGLANSERVQTWLDGFLNGPKHQQFVPSLDFNTIAPFVMNK